MAKFISWYLAGDLSCAATIVENQHVSQSVLSKFKQILKTHELEDLANGRKLDVDEWQASDNECSRKIESSLNDWRAHLMFTPRNILVGLNKTKLFIYSCEYDVLRDDAFLFAKLLQANSIDLDHLHINTCYHGCMCDRTEGAFSVMNVLYSKVQAALT